MFESARWLVSLPNVVGNDYRLIATFEYEEIARKYSNSASTAARPTSVAEGLMQS